MDRGVRGTLLARTDSEADVSHVGCVVDVSSLVEGQACSALFYFETGLIDTLVSIDWCGRTLLYVECAREIGRELAFGVVENDGHSRCCVDVHLCLLDAQLDGDTGQIAPLARARVLRIRLGSY